MMNSKLYKMLPSCRQHALRSFKPTALYSISSLRLYSQQASLSITKDIPNDIGFAFDIDGVLLRSSTPIGNSPRTLDRLYKHNIPFVLLTNGGGKSEIQRVCNLRKYLGEDRLDPSQLVQSHTPFQELKHSFDETILVVGGERDECREVARGYGFNNVIIPADILSSRADIWPFSSSFGEYYTSFPSTTKKQALDLSKLKVSAILVFNDPRDWALDTQVIIDLLVSSQGRYGTISSKNGDKSLQNNGWQKDGQPKIYFSNDDLWWANSNPLPRLGQGAFRMALEGIWKGVTRGQAELEREVIGKPFRLTYAFAEKRLEEVRQRIQQGDKGGNLGKGLRKVYMIGDNPDSDIRGANDYRSEQGREWTSILVKTGVYRGGTPVVEPKVIVEDVEAGVEWALRDACH